MQEKLKTKTPEQALRTLMNLAAKSEKSSGDALRLMARWGVEPSRRSEILQQLIADKFIDDSRYAQAYVREKTNLNGWGIHKISRMLATKGISKEIIAEVTKAIDHDKAESKLREMLMRKKNSIKGKDEYQLKAALVRFGLGRGYVYDSVMESVEKIMKGDNDHAG